MKNRLLFCSIVVGLAGCGNGEGNPFDSNSGTAGTDTDSDSDSATDSATTTQATSNSGSGSTGTTGTTSGGIKLDVGAATTGDLCGCGLGTAFSYIWISNSSEGTVSKINTETLEEEARYITRPDGAGNPSRTSVSFSGDVAIANRHGGLTKIYARPEDCVDDNGTPGLQTSDSKTNVLAWDFEECVAWYTSFPATNQRPVAWAQGTLNTRTCKYEDEKVWTVTSATPGFAPGTGGPGGVIVSRVNGDTGAIEDSIPIDTFSGFQLGAYGGAVDADGNFWFSPMGALELMGYSLARVDAGNLTYELFPVPAGIAAYGITVDHNGRVWLSSTLGAGAARFDPETETWETVANAFVSSGGLQEDGNGQMWVSTGMPVGAVAIDVETMMPGKQFISGGGEVKGISIDVDGYLWAVSSSTAFKVDPDTLTFETYTGLDSPYTYSDMTGWALHNASCPPEG